VSGYLLLFFLCCGSLDVWCSSFDVCFSSLGVHFTCLSLCALHFSFCVLHLSFFLCASPLFLSVCFTPPLLLCPCVNEMGTDGKNSTLLVVDLSKGISFAEAASHSWCLRWVGFSLFFPPFPLQTFALPLSL